MYSNSRDILKQLRNILRESDACTSFEAALCSIRILASSIRDECRLTYLVREERDERQHGVQPSSTTILHTVDLSFFPVSALILPRSSNNNYDEREHTSISLTVTHRDRGIIRCNQDSDTPISLSSFCPSLSAFRVQASIQNHN